MPTGKSQPKSKLLVLKQQQTPTKTPLENKENKNSRECVFCCVKSVRSIRKINYRSVPFLWNFTSKVKFDICLLINCKPESKMESYALSIGIVNRRSVLWEECDKSRALSQIHFPREKSQFIWSVYFRQTIATGCYLAHNLKIKSSH